MTFVRRATIAAALLAVPVVAAFAISTSASAAPATSGSVLASQVGDTSDALVDTQSAVTTPGGTTVTEVKYTKKKKKKAKKKTAAKKPAAAPAPVTAPAPAPGGQPESTSQVAAVEASVINLTNAQRVANGCGAMHTDNRLTAAALAHSTDMVTHNFFSHTGSDGSDFVTREARAGYSAASAENIAWGWSTAEIVVREWMNSPGHRANILNCGNVAVGVGLVKKADGTPYWTQDFGRS